MRTNTALYIATGVAALIAGLSFVISPIVAKTKPLNMRERILVWVVSIFGVFLILFGVLVLSLPH